MISDVVVGTLGRMVRITVDADLPALGDPILDRANLFGGSTTPGELWPALVEICHFQKSRRELPQVRVKNRDPE